MKAESREKKDHLAYMHRHQEKDGHTNNFQKGTDPCFSNQIPMISTEITEFKNKGKPTVALETDNNILEKNFTS